MQFKKAVKYGAKGRVAFIGPAGAGKSMTMLKLARSLAGPEGKIAAIDTEHGSLSKYADQFAFDVIELDVFSPENFIAALDAAEAAKYDVFCCDSLSHFWMGRGGALEFVDMAAKRHKDQMGGWKDFRPHERMMVDRMIASPCHIIVTMRTKTDYQEVDAGNGKKKRIKVGLAPIQRDGLEYEFDLVGYMDDENTLIVDKTRCPALSQKAFTKPGDAEFQPFLQWLSGAERVIPKLTDQEVADHKDRIENAVDLDALKSAYMAAYKHAHGIADEARLKEFEAAKDARKTALAAKAPANGATSPLVEPAKPESAQAAA